MPPKLAVVNLAGLLTITPSKPTCDQIGNCLSKHYQSNAMEGEIKSKKLIISLTNKF